jgi:hypothetical protein
VNNIVGPKQILDHLLSAPPVRLNAVPTGAGIYALYDHEGRARYIGITAKCLHDRIYKRHVGGDNNSHKFSTIYNAARMFHSRKHPATCMKDGPVSKELRRLFIREHCRAVAIPMYGLEKQKLLEIEAKLLSDAPFESTRWNNVRELQACEPVELLNGFLEELGWPQVKLDAIERQARRWTRG